ncbi:MAG: hypothetical protein M1840_004987 [Geoglossum simile]|nr:MAG: hypothetical protein M1840_004987 [Geoglossum simile]
MHIEWAEFMGSQILYIHGSSYRATHDVADQVFLAWQAKRRDKDEGYAKALSFAFDSADPLRNSVPDMLASVLIQALAGQSTGFLDEQYYVLRDRFLFYGGWTEKSYINTLGAMRHVSSGPATLLLLHDLDECSQDSRAVFLDYYKRLSEGSEYPLKVLVTSRKPRALLEELQGWPKINVDDLAPHADNDMGDETDRLMRLCPVGDGGDRIRGALNRLAPMNGTNLQVSLKLLQEHTGWPKDPSLESLTQFTHLLDRITPRDTPKNVLDKILRSNPDIEGLCWALNWLLCGYRPLSLWELTTILFHRRQRNHEIGAHPLDLSFPTSMKGLWCELESWLRVLAEFSHDQVTIRSEIRELLTGDTETDKYIWNEVRRTAHQTIAEFCFAHVITGGRLCAGRCARAKGAWASACGQRGVTMLVQSGVSSDMGPIER